MYVRNATKGIQLYNVLTKLQAENNLVLYKSHIKTFLKNNYKKNNYNLKKKMVKGRSSLKLRRIFNFLCIQLIKFKIKKFNKINIYCPKFKKIFKKILKFFNLIYVNFNLHKSFKKKKMFRFIV